MAVGGVRDGKDLSLLRSLGKNVKAQVCKDPHGSIFLVLLTDSEEIQIPFSPEGATQLGMLLIQSAQGPAIKTT